jgi:hypothetical protein
MHTYGDIKKVVFPEELTGLQIASLVRAVIDANRVGEFTSEVIFKDDYYLRIGQRSPRSTACVSVCVQDEPEHMLRAYRQYEDVNVISSLPSNGIVYPPGCNYVDQVIEEICRFIRDLDIAYLTAKHQGGVSAMTLDALL